jgi:hypothetical protein
VSWPVDQSDALALVAAHLPGLVAGAWVVRVPGLSREEGHEAITRAAWVGLGLNERQQDALIAGVRAPDVGITGLLSSPLPFAQPRHALRRWWGTTTRQGVADLRRFVMEQHLRALQLADGRRWHAFGRVIHALQDSYSPAHAEREGGRIVRMKHWGALDPLRAALGRDGRDQHGFPADPRDGAWVDGSLTAAAAAASTASREYLELVLAHGATEMSDDARWDQLAALMDRHLST